MIIGIAKRDLVTKLGVIRAGEQCKVVDTWINKTLNSVYVKLASNQQDNEFLCITDMRDIELVK